MVRVLVLVVALVSGGSGVASASLAEHSSTRGSVPGHGPYPCAPGSAESIHGPFGDASALGWQGNSQGVVACLGGQLLRAGRDQHDVRLRDLRRRPDTWADADGYLPAQVPRSTRGRRSPITEFADQSRWAGDLRRGVQPGRRPQSDRHRRVTADPEPSPGLVPLDSASGRRRAPAAAVNQTTSSRSTASATYPWPSADGAGRRRWLRSSTSRTCALLGRATRVDRRRSAFPTASSSTRTAAGSSTPRSRGAATHLEHRREQLRGEYSHDVIGILANFFTQGDFTDAQALLLEARNVIGAQGQYEDGLWTYCLAVGDLPPEDRRPRVRRRRTSSTRDRSGRAAEHRGHRAPHRRRPHGPNRIIGAPTTSTRNGYWTVDNYEALMGLAAYRYLAQRVGDTARGRTGRPASTTACSRPRTARSQATIRRYHLATCRARWSSPTPRTGAEPEGRELGGAVPVRALGLGRTALRRHGERTGRRPHRRDLHLRVRPAHGQAPTRHLRRLPRRLLLDQAYNAGYGSWGLASQAHRDQGILGYEFMIGHTQSGPYSWWESVSAPNPASPWVGSHPSDPGKGPRRTPGASPTPTRSSSTRSWPNDPTDRSSSAEAYPTPGSAPARPSRSPNFPTTDGRRIGFTISTHDRTVTLTLTGDPTPGPVLFQLPAFVANVRPSGSATIDSRAGTVTVPSGATHVSVELLRQP